jgi:hypothetical protein
VGAWARAADVERTEATKRVRSVIVAGVVTGTGEEFCCSLRLPMVRFKVLFPLFEMAMRVSIAVNPMSSTRRMLDRRPAGRTMILLAGL